MAKRKSAEDKELGRQLGGRIAQAREEAGLTQQDLAIAIGATPSLVSTWENGAVPIFRYLTKLPVALGVESHWLLTAEEPMKRAGESEAQLRLAAAREATKQLVDALQISGTELGKGRASRPPDSP